jgi:predicted metalloprotease
MRKADLDQIIRGYLKVADPVGVDPRQQGAHGSYFDRVSALAEGYENGTTGCRDDFGPERVFTELGGATDPASLNAPYDTTLQIVDNTLPPFWKQVFSTAFGKDFHEPAITPFSGTAPRCASGNRDLVYCHSDHTVYYDETDLVRPAYEQVGDFAVNTAISLPYALAVRDQLGRSTKGAAATRSAVCLTGWYEAQIFNGAFQSANVQISPGDVDEAVVFLLDYGVRNSVFPDTNASGFQLLLSYRAGFLQGGAPCDVGISD